MVSAADYYSNQRTAYDPGMGLDEICDALNAGLYFGVNVGFTLKQRGDPLDDLPNSEPGAPWLRLQYNDPDVSVPRAIDLSFYGFGSIFRFAGDGTTVNGSRSALEFWGRDQFGAPEYSSYRPILTMVCGDASVEHEVHVARNPEDTDGIINSYLASGTPAIFTEAGQAASIDYGAQRLRKVRISTSNLNLVSGHTLGWTSSTTDPGGTVDIKLSRAAAGILAFGDGGSGATTKTTLSFNNGGYSAPGNCETTADGDKAVFWNTDTLKVAQGLGDALFWWQINSSVGDPTFKWYGGTTVEPAEHMSLNSAGLLTVTVGGIKTAAPNTGTAGTWKLGVAASVSPSSPNRTIELDVNGTIYYLHAKTTND